jgi:glycosyltransferase involved in cell wall biosynthesis
MEDLAIMKKLISIIIPAYNETDCVDELARRLTLVFQSEPAYDFECVIVENGSLDDTYEKLLKINAADSRFKILKLARNFRMDGGLTAGLSHVTGDACVLMTADLQDPPELIPDFLRLWEQGYENVYGVVTERQGTGPIRTFNSKAFYWLANTLTDGRVTKNASDFRLVDRTVYESVRAMDERNRFVRGLFSWVGFNSIGVPMVRPPRHGGVSNAHTLKVLDLAFKGIFAHSYKPLRLISVIGMLVSLGAVITTIWLAVQAVAFGVPFSGYGTIMCTLLLGIGIITLLLGVIGEYLALIYEEVKRRPNYIVSKKIGF